MINVMKQFFFLIVKLLLFSVQMNYISTGKNWHIMLCLAQMENRH